MDQLPPHILAKLREDFSFYAKTCVKIRPKDGENVPFILNAAQRKLDAIVEAQKAKTGRVRVIILKARQQGFSTYVSARIFRSVTFNKNKKGLVIAHKADSARTLLNMYRRVFKELPLPLRPSTSYASARELHFDKLDSGIKIDSASGHGVGAGETINYAHLSEAGKWDENFAADNFAYLMQAIPPGPGTEVYVESTADGMSGTFYDLWQGAVAGQNGFIPFFSPWFDSPEYRDTARGVERTIEEQELVERYGLDDEQLAFRYKIVSTNGLDKFEQEYPSNPEEAFKASGRPVFDPNDVHRQLHNAKPLLYTMSVDDDVPYKHSRGELSVYHELDPRETYTIGADVAMGIAHGDYSVAQVLDSKRRQVAVWRGHLLPDAFATVLYRLGMYYNVAKLVPEKNNHGFTTTTALNNLDYPNIFKEIREGQPQERSTENLGFNTLQSSKQQIINKLRGVLAQNSIEINDVTTLKEMLTYIVNTGNKYQAQARCHDDCVVSLAIASSALELGVWKPVESPEDCYFDAI